MQLVGGSYEQERVRLDDPHGVLSSWTSYGFSNVHLVDLDAATGRGSNRELVRELMRDTSLAVQVGGGVREIEHVESLLADGARSVVVGTRALEEPDWLARMAGVFPGEIIVAADVRDRRAVTRGWSRTLPRLILDVVAEIGHLPLAGILVTAVHREGQMNGTDLRLMEDVAESAGVPVYASGGVATLNDLRALADRGIAAAVLGMALYTGALDPWVVAEEFSE